MIRSRLERVAMLVFVTKRPNENEIKKCLLQTAETDLTYDAVGATNGTAPSGTASTTIGSNSPRIGDPRMEDV